jgi:hypothetical protein
MSQILPFFQTELQAVARVYRLGQKSSVFAVLSKIANSVEAKINLLQNEKLTRAAQLTGDSRLETHKTAAYGKVHNFSIMLLCAHELIFSYYKK